MFKGMLFNSLLAVRILAWNVPLTMYLYSAYFTLDLESGLWSITHKAQWAKKVGCPKTIFTSQNP